MPYRLSNVPFASPLVSSLQQQHQQKNAKKKGLTKSTAVSLLRSCKLWRPLALLLTAAIPSRTLTIQIATILSRRIAIQHTHQARTFALLCMQQQQQQRGGWKQQKQSAIVMRCKCAYSLFKVDFGLVIVPSPPPPLRRPSLAPVSVSSIIRPAHAYQFLSRFQSRYSSSSSIPPILFPCTRDWGPPHFAQIASTQSVHAAVVTPRTPQGEEGQKLECTYISSHFFSGYIQPKSYI
jgi:hypothetical protein